MAALAAAGLLLSAYSLLPTREYASHATGQRQAQNTKFTVVASASASKKLLAERGFTAHSVEARFDIANPDLRVALAAATARQASQATAVHSVDIKSHPVFSSLSFDRDAKRHAASVLDFSKMRDHGDLARHRDHFEHPNLSTIETLLDHALRTRKLSILYADWRNVKAEAHFDLGDVDTREHAPPHAVELADDTAASKHAFDRIEHTRDCLGT